MYNYEYSPVTACEGSMPEHEDINLMIPTAGIPTASQWVGCRHGGFSFLCIEELSRPCFSMQRYAEKTKHEAYG